MGFFDELGNLRDAWNNLGVPAPEKSGFTLPTPPHAPEQDGPRQVATPNQVINSPVSFTDMIDGLSALYFPGRIDHILYMKAFTANAGMTTEITTTIPDGYVGILTEQLRAYSSYYDPSILGFFEVDQKQEAPYGIPAGEALVAKTPFVKPIYQGAAMTVINPTAIDAIITVQIPLTFVEKTLWTQLVEPALIRGFASLAQGL